MTLLHGLLVLHLAGLILGFVGGRSHAEIMKQLPSAKGNAIDILWSYESKASWISFIGTGILIVSGAAMLWLKWGGPMNQQTVFYVKMVFVVLVAWAEIARHLSARQWRRGNDAMHQHSRLWGKISGLSAIATLVLGVVSFN